MSTDGRARSVEALLDYVLRRDAEVRRRFEERFGVSFDDYLEMLGNEPIVTVHWKQ